MEKILIALGMFIGLCLAFEVVILGIAFLGADKVECNLLWCTFSTTRQEAYNIVHSSRDCSVNGKPVNCSGFAEEFPDWASHGWTEMNGVCPGWDDNRTLADCLK